MKIASLIVALAFAGSVYAGDDQPSATPAGGGQAAQVDHSAHKVEKKVKHKKKKGEAKKEATH